jgi:Transposase DDE domain
LVDTDHGVIVDVEATRAIRQAEVGAARTMLERTEDRFGLKPDYVTADSAYGSAESLAWLNQKQSRRWYRPISALGHQDLANWCSAIDHHQGSRWTCTFRNC